MTKRCKEEKKKKKQDASSHHLHSLWSNMETYTLLVVMWHGTTPNQGICYDFIKLPGDLPLESATSSKKLP